MNNGFDLLAISDKAEDLCRTHHGGHASSGLPVGERLVAQAVKVPNDIDNGLPDLLGVFRL